MMAKCNINDPLVPQMIMSIYIPVGTILWGQNFYIQKHVLHRPFAEFFPIKYFFKVSPIQTHVVKFGLIKYVKVNPESLLDLVSLIIQTNGFKIMNFLLMKKKLKRFLPYLGMTAIGSFVLDHLCKRLFPLPKEAPIGQVISGKKMFKYIAPAQTPFWGHFFILT